MTDASAVACPWQEPRILHPNGDRPCWSDAVDADEMHDECRTAWASPRTDSRTPPEAQR